MEQLRATGFAWPFTEPLPGGGSLIPDLAPDSPLSRLGYSVATRGPEEPERRRILKFAFNDELPFSSKEEEENWGEPKSAERLQRIANHIAFQIRSQKRKSKPAETAIARWSEDLAWLKRTYYDGTVYSFPWP